MDKKEILKLVDHTILAPAATWEDVRALIDDAIHYNTASVCISPCHVKQAAEYAAGRMKICTVIGFPSGANTTKVKVFEVEEAIREGAVEVDMVINIGWVKAGRYDLVQEEIAALKKAAGDKILKVIIETCLLTDEEKIRMCEAVTAAGADFIKTSTGFSTGGATPADVALMKAHVGEGVLVKAAGGISSWEDAEAMIAAGASRLGTSRLVKMAKKEEGV